MLLCGLFAAVCAHLIARALLCRFMFVEFGSQESADLAQQILNGFKLDKNHTFIVNKHDDFAYHAQVSDTYEPPTVQSKAPTVECVCLPVWFLCFSVCLEFL